MFREKSPLNLNIKITRLFLTPNKYSRPQRPLHKIKGLVVHWVANPKTTARFNRNYFELRKNGRHGYGSAHFVVDDNEIIQCIPLNEMAYHVGAKEYSKYALEKFGDYPNNCTIGVELCHLDWEGRFSRETLNNAIKIFAWLSNKFELNPLEDITTHHAITGKICPKWFVDHSKDFEEFKWNVYNYMTNYQLI